MKMTRGVILSVVFGLSFAAGASPRDYGCDFDIPEQFLKVKSVDCDFSDHTGDYLVRYELHLGSGTSWDCSQLATGSRPKGAITVDVYEKHGRHRHWVQEDKIEKVRFYGSKHLESWGASENSPYFTLSLEVIPWHGSEDIVIRGETNYGPGIALGLDKCRVIY